MLAGSANGGVFRLNDRVVVITGAAHGIGRALAFALIEKGCHLALIDQDEPALSRLAHELHLPGTRRVSTHLADVSDRARMGDVAAEVLSTHGAVHVLVNSAGIAHEAPFVRTSLDDWHRIVAVNLMGVVHACHFFLPHLARADRGHIVNMSSLLGVIGMPGQTAYGASKFAIRGLSESLQEELRGTTVGLTLVHPGAVNTGITLRGRGDDVDLLQRIDAWYQRHALRPELVARRIVAAIERGTPRLLIGADSRFADLLKRLLPVAGNSMFVRAAIRILGVGDMRAKREAQWRTFRS